MLVGVPLALLSVVVVLVLMVEEVEGRWMRCSAEPLVPARVADRRPIIGPGLCCRREER
jgi:hypothetical protein